MNMFRILKFRIGALALILASTGISEETADRQFSDVKTKFAANLALWFGGKQVPMVEKIEKAHELGFDAVEFWSYAGEDIDAIAAKCEELGVKVVQFTAWGKPLGSGENIDEFEEGVRDALRVAKKLGASKMTVTGHRWVEGYSLESQLANYAAAMKRVAPLCEQAGVMIIVEPFNPVDHGKNFLNGSQAAVELCREVGSPMIKINWDFYHMQLSEGALITYLEKGYDQVGYLQLADTPGRHQPGTGEPNPLYPRASGGAGAEGMKKGILINNWFEAHQLLIGVTQYFRTGRDTAHCRCSCRSSFAGARLFCHSPSDSMESELIV